MDGLLMRGFIIIQMRSYIMGICFSKTKSVDETAIATTEESSSKEKTVKKQESSYFGGSFFDSSPSLRERREEQARRIYREEHHQNFSSHDWDNAYKTACRQIIS